LSASGQEVSHDQRGSGRAALDEAEEGTEVSGGGKAREVQVGQARTEGLVEHGEAVRDVDPVEHTGVVMGTYEPAGEIVTGSFAQD
jgi:hypothetical protein